MSFSLGSTGGDSLGQSPSATDTGGYSLGSSPSGGGSYAGTDTNHTSTSQDSGSYGNVGGSTPSTSYGGGTNTAGGGWGQSPQTSQDNNDSDGGGSSYNSYPTTYTVPGTTHTVTPVNPAHVTVSHDLPGFTLGNAATLGGTSFSSPTHLTVEGQMEAALGLAPLTPSITIGNASAPDAHDFLAPTGGLVTASLGGQAEGPFGGAMVTGPMARPPVMAEQPSLVMQDHVASSPFTLGSSPEPGTLVPMWSTEPTSIPATPGIVVSDQPSLGGQAEGPFGGAMVTGPLARPPVMAEQPSLVMQDHVASSPFTLGENIGLDGTVDNTPISIGTAINHYAGDPLADNPLVTASLGGSAQGPFGGAMVTGPMARPDAHPGLPGDVENPGVATIPDFITDEGEHLARSAVIEPLYKYVIGPAIKAYVPGGPVAEKVATIGFYSLFGNAIEEPITATVDNGYKSLGLVETGPKGAGFVASGDKVTFGIPTEALSPGSVLGGQPDDFTLSGIKVPEGTDYTLDGTGGTSLGRTVDAVPIGDFVLDQPDVHTRGGMASEPISLVGDPFGEAADTDYGPQPVEVRLPDYVWDAPVSLGTATAASFGSGFIGAGTAAVSGGNPVAAIAATVVAYATLSNLLTEPFEAVREAGFKLAGYEHPGPGMVLFEFDAPENSPREPTADTPLPHDYIKSGVGTPAGSTDVPSPSIPVPTWHPTDALVAGEFTPKHTGSDSIDSPNLTDHTATIIASGDNHFDLDTSPQETLVGGFKPDTIVADNATPGSIGSFNFPKNDIQYVGPNDNGDGTPWWLLEQNQQSDHNFDLVIEPALPPHDWPLAA